MLRFVSLLLVLWGLAASGCRGDGTGADAGASRSGTAVETVVAGFQTVFAGFGPAMVVALDPEAQPVKTDVISAVEEIRDYTRQIVCDPEGTGSVDGRVDDLQTRGTFSIEVDFKDCDGVDGIVDAVGSFVRAAATVDLNWGYDGEASLGGCAADLSGLSFTSVVPLTGAAGSTLVTGDVSADCGDATVLCRWNAASATDASALSAGCSCSGTGC